MPETATHRCSRRHSPEVHRHHGLDPLRCLTEDTMLQTLAIVLLVLWVLGIVSAYTMGGFIHVLLVVAIVLILVRIISGRKIG